jgi:hypothetical protein
LTITTSATGPDPTTAGFLDGMFSLGFRINTGAMELISISGTVTNSAGATVTITPSPATPVPEPATLLLLTAAACGLLIRRKSR